MKRPSSSSVNLRYSESGGSRLFILFFVLPPDSIKTDAFFYVGKYVSPEVCLQEAVNWKAYKTKWSDLLLAET